MKKTPPKYIFVTGGVLSGVGKGITAASIGAIMKARGYTVSMQKCDPYLNVDAGTLNPAEHGECFVTADGAETDLDLGHYERFLNIDTSRDSITLSGRLLRDLIADERAGKYLGKTVQLVPHLTDAIQEAIVKAGQGSDLHIVEIGGTVGDYEGLSFIEAIREFAAQAEPGTCAFVHVVYVPYLHASKEFKTKPAQNALRDLRNFGIVPDLIAARVEQKPSADITRKLSLFGGVRPEAVIVLPNADTVYRVPETLENAGVGELLSARISLPPKKADISAWTGLTDAVVAKKASKCRIGIVAKYLDNEDTYMSVIEALKAAAWARNTDLHYEWIDAEQLEESGCDSLSAYDGILVPGGFGTRGVEGKIAAAGWALENGKPYLGLCLGLQAAVIAAVRLGGVTGATSAELDPAAKDQAIYIMDDQRGKESTGGTMRLGNYPAKLVAGSKVAELYGATTIAERHRHRYEVNRTYEPQVNQGGLAITGQSPDGTLVEFVEGSNHPFFVATQAHPEFRSRPLAPHPLFLGFIDAAISR